MKIIRAEYPETRLSFGDPIRSSLVTLHCSLLEVVLESIEFKLDADFDDELSLSFLISRCANELREWILDSDSFG